ncbi:hypothetical protein [Simonsiella muelleri]|uniref:hypothetical protein n=1 Tax=Simonsiella muelleri TaxID=72 RepID=UPI0023F3D622|nr:hypothetical protein [Simonsiella muelleri]
MKKLWILGATFLLAACGNEMSDRNLKEAINEGVKFRNVCLPFQLNVQNRLNNENPHQTTLGEPVIKLLKRLESGKRANERAFKQMESLVRAGLYKAEKEERIGTGETALHYAVFTLTERGRGEIHLTPQGTLLCVGKQKAKKINYYTEPTTMDGLIVTNVSYQAKLQPEKWANNLLDDTPYENLGKETTTQTATLVKTSQGWRDILELR